MAATPALTPQRVSAVHATVDQPQAGRTTRAALS